MIIVGGEAPPASAPSSHRAAVVPEGFPVYRFPQLLVGGLEGNADLELAGGFAAAAASAGAGALGARYSAAVANREAEREALRAEMEEVASIARMLGRGHGGPGGGRAAPAAAVF